MIMEKIERWQLRLGWHWLWFVPLALLLLLFVEQHTVLHAFRIVKLAWQRWSWGVLFSPSAAFCLGVIAFSIIWPLRSLALVGFLAAAKNQWRWVLLIVGTTLIFPFVTDFLTWGSFPLIIDDAGVARLRMIPFIPWPSGNYGEY
jgi:hypothetical protein